MLGPHLISTFRTLATCNELREIEIHCLNVVVCFQPKCTGSRMRPGMYNGGALPGCGPSDFIGGMQYWVCGHADYSLLICLGLEVIRDKTPMTQKVIQ